MPDKQHPPQELTAGQKAILDAIPLREPGLIRAPATPAQPVMPEPVALVQFLEGLLDTWGRPPSEEELRAVAHAMTVKADRIAASQRQAGGTIGPEDC